MLTLETSNSKIQSPKVNLNELDILAKLMARENIVVEHSQVSTASFDVERRVLSLPMWKNLTRNIYHLLVTHEIGHALETPALEWRDVIKSHMHLKTFINVIEDAREERLIKNRYPGSRRDFRNGYFELYQQDFFKIKDKDVNRSSFIDRINLHYKIGENIKVNFSSDEMKFIDQIDKVVSFQEVVKIAEQLYALAKSKEDEKEKKRETQSGLPEIVDIPPESTAEKDEEEDEEGAENGDEEVSELDAETVDALESSIQDNFIDKAARPTAYMDLDIDCAWKEYVVSYDTLINSSKTTYLNLLKNNPNRYNLNLNEYSLNGDQYKKLRNNSLKMVDYLVKEFEIRKAAYVYVRTRESKTGVLNPSKLHSYQLIDDIFKRSVISPESKNHGIIIYVDFSASMIDNLKGTIDQLFNLVLFCRKIKIPHRVYGFTNQKSDREVEDKRNAAAQARSNTKNRLLYSVSPDTALIELFNEKMSMGNLRDMIEILMNRCNKHLISSDHLRFSNTPLNSCAILARNMLSDFKKETNAQIISAVFLTDGGNNCRNYVSPQGSQWLTYSSNVILCDPKTKKLYKMNNEVSDRLLMTTKLMDILRGDGYHVIAFRIDYRSSIIKAIRSSRVYNLEMADKLIKTLRKDKSVTLSNFYGTDEYHMISSDALNSDEKFSMDVDVGSTKSKLKTAFIKARGRRIDSRAVLKNFALRISK